MSKCPHCDKDEAIKERWANFKIETEQSVFLRELAELCKKHNLSLSHEDTQGAFIVEEYKEENIKWLMDAMLRPNS